MTSVAEALRDAAARLAGASDTARLDAEWLMAEALEMDRSEMLLSHSQAAAPFAFSGLVERRLSGEPLAYILGRQAFFGREFLVTPEVLIPRADSETTVQAALDNAPDAGRILDCGTGSGALLLTLLAQLPDAAGVGVDRSLGALAVAAANAAMLGLASRARMLARDWHDAGWADDLGRFDLVIANPPYVAVGTQLDAGVAEYEPAGALFAGSDGLGDYRILIPQLRGLLVPGGHAVLEIGFDQAESVAELARKSDFSTILYRDLADRPRVLVLRGF